MKDSLLLKLSLNPLVRRAMFSFQKREYKKITIYRRVADVTKGSLSYLYYLPLLKMFYEVEETAHKVKIVKQVEGRHKITKKKHNLITNGLTHPNGRRIP